MMLTVYLKMKPLIYYTYGFVIGVLYGWLRSYNDIIPPAVRHTGFLPSKLQIYHLFGLICSKMFRKQIIT